MISLKDFFTKPKEENIVLIEEERYCKCCKQKMPRLYKFSLSKNVIYFLAKLNLNLNQDGFIETKDIYGLGYKGTNTAVLTQLKYFGALNHYFLDEDHEKKSGRSGKWTITESGLNFLKGESCLPKWVEVYNSRVVERGQNINIQDDCLKWQTEDDIWDMIRGV